MLLALSTSDSLQASTSSTSLLKQTSFRQFSTEHGLSQNTINRFYQDKSGFIWVATSSGLNILEGNRIQIYGGPDDLLVNAEINQVIEDSQGNLWVAAYDELIRFSDDRLSSEVFYRPLSANGASQPNTVIELIEEEADKFWVVTNHGVIQLRPSAKDLQPFQSTKQLLEADVTILSAANDGQQIWLATSQGVYRFDKRTGKLDKQQFGKIIDNAWIYEILRYENDLFISSDQGLDLVSLNADPIAPKSIIKDETVYTIERVAEQIFFAVADELHVYNPANQGSHHLLSLSETLTRFSGYAISELFADNTDKLWIGTQSDGAYLWDPKSLNFRTVSNLTANTKLQLSNNNVWSMIEDELQNLWVGTDEGLNYVDLENAQVQQFLNNEPELDNLQKQIFFIIDDDQLLWLATADGLVKFNKATSNYKLYRPDSYGPSKPFFVFAMTQLPDRSIWLATKSGAIQFTPGSEQFEFPRELESAPNSEYATFIRYQNDKLWVGYRDRLETFNPETGERQTVFQFNHLIKYKNLALTDFYLDGNRLWVSFNANGIYVIDLNQRTPTITKELNQKNGFVNNIVHRLLPQKDYLWASTHRGLIKINKTDFSYQVLDYFSGLPTNEFNEGAGYKAKNGDLIFGGINGFLRFSPDELEEPITSVVPKITRVTIQDRSLSHNGIPWESRNVLVKGNEELISVEFSVLDYFTPHQWHYEYWLTGNVESKPKKIDSDFLTLSNLSPGKYQLNIRANIPHYKTFESVAKLPFEVSTPSRPYFVSQIVIGVLLTLIIILVFYRMNTAALQLQKNNRKLQQREQRLKLALIDKERGVWDWTRISNALDDSVIRIIVAGSEDIVLSITNYLSLIHTEDLKEIQKIWNRFIDGKTVEIGIAYRIHLFDRWIWCRMVGRASGYDTEGKPVRATGAWLDITQEIEAEEKLRVYEKAIHSTRDIIFILNHDLTIRLVNNAYRQLTGYSASSLIGKNLLDIAHKRFGPEMAEELKTQIRNNHGWQGEANMPIKGSPSYPIDVRIDPFDPNDEKTDYIIVMTDISSFSARMESKISNSYYDNLTGLPNRVLAKDRLSHAIAHARLHKTNVVLLAIDLDDFAGHAQTLGKSGSRELVVKSSQQIAKALNKDDTFARIDSDQFYIILENIDKLENISFKIDEIKSKLNKGQKIGKTKTSVSACIGIACFPQDASTTVTLTEAAETALEQAKSAGSDQVSYFYRDMNKRAADRLAMKTSLHYAIKNTWHRKYMQWETPLTIKPGSNQEFLLTRSESQCSTSNCASILKIPLNDAEYILLENRQRSTSHDGTFTITNDQDLTFTIRIDSITSDFDSNNVNGIISSVSSYDAGLPGSGVLVWRINENAIEKFIENNLISTYDEKQFENHITGISLIEADQDQTMGLPLSSSFATFGTASDIYPHINTTDKDTIQSISSAHPAFKSSRSGSANFKLTIHLPGNAYQEKSQNQYTGDSIITFEADTFRVSIEWENNWVPNSKWPVSTIPYQIPQGLHFTDSILLYSSLTGFQQLYDYNGSPVFSDSLDTLEVKQQLPTSKLKQDSTTLITTSLFGQHSTTITSTASDSILYSRGLNQKLYYKHLDSITAPYDSLDIPCTIGPLLWNGMIICASSSPTQQLHWQNTNGSITSKNLPSGMVAQSIALMRDSNAIAIIGSHARVAICKIDGSSSCYFVEPKSVSSASRHLISVSDFDQNDTLDAFILAENGSINIINLSSGKWMHSALQFPFGESGTLNDLSPPAISDIDLDGYPDIIYSRNNKVFALNHKLNALEGFPFELPENIIVNPFGNTLFPPGKMNSSPLLLNVNSDENPEILFTTPDGLIYALDFQGSLVNESESIGWPFTAGSFFLKDTLKNLNDTLTNPYVYLHSTVKLGNTYLAANSVKSLYLWQLSADNNSPNRWLTHSGNYERHNYFDASSVKSNSNVNQNIVEKFYIFPNPIKSANAAVMLSLNQDVEKFTLYFYDISGHEIWSKTFRGMEKGENQKIPFGLEIHESGIYTVKNVVHYEDGSGKTYWDRIAILR